MLECGRNYDAGYDEVGVPLVYFDASSIERSMENVVMNEFLSFEE